LAVANPISQLPLVIVTYRDVFQWVAKLKDEMAEYQDRSAVVLMAAGDMKALGIEDGAWVELSNPFGRVVARAKLDRGGSPGIGLMPVSPWANLLTSYQPSRGRLPNFKRVEVMVRAADRTKSGDE